MEQPPCGPLPPAPYDVAVWKRVSVYRDCYVSSSGRTTRRPSGWWARRSGCAAGRAPSRSITPTTSWWPPMTAPRPPGERLTHLDHLPPEKVPGLLITRERCREQAGAIGPATAALVEQLLAHRPEDRLRSAGRCALGGADHPGAAGAGLCTGPGLRGDRLRDHPAHPGRGARARGPCRPPSVSGASLVGQQ